MDDDCLLVDCSLLSPGVCPCVRLSVCLSVTFMYCIQMAEDIVKFLPRLHSPIIWVENHSRQQCSVLTTSELNDDDDDDDDNE